MAPRLQQSVEPISKFVFGSRSRRHLISNHRHTGVFRGFEI